MGRQDRAGVWAPGAHQVRCFLSVGVKRGPRDGGVAQAPRDGGVARALQVKCSHLAD